MQAKQHKLLLHVPEGAGLRAERGARTGKFAPSGVDTVSLIRALDFGDHLRGQNHLSPAVKACIDFAFPNETHGEIEPDAVNPDKNMLYRGRLRLDPVAMLVERREIAAFAVCPDDIESIHIHADGSPVTGTEIQGMVYEMFLKGGQLITNTLPPYACNTDFIGPLISSLRYCGQRG